jgi:hypothetical protein
MSNSPRNPAVGTVLALLGDLDFVTRLSDDGQMWIADRHSGMFVRTLVFPDDPSVPREIIIAALWIQGAEIEEELVDAIRDLSPELDELAPGGDSDE